MPASVDRAARAVARGELVAYPTDTLWGLGARATDARAVARLQALKGRPDGMPISIAVSSVPEIDRWAALSAPARAFARRYLPGPFTLLVPASAPARARLAPGIAGPDGTIGVRVPDHAGARELLRRTGPLTATSLNRHGARPAATLAEARRAFPRGVAAFLTGGATPSGRPSTLADLRGDRVRLVARR